MFTGNKDFYPTPPNLISKMLSGIDFSEVSSILEPSAGKGDLADKIKERMQGAHRASWHEDKYIPDLDCVELQQDLQSILRGKGHRVIHNDFLTLCNYKKYDLIVANPPFSDGAKHLLKMLEMQKKTAGELSAS